ncbi:hypothetical protein, partial [Microseira wollei]|uniref:hypothetical protein n=1 Tax=Microseira wollei TaxID=467598 RepID=UPI001CFDA4B1
MINICLGQNIPAAVPLRVHHPNPVGARHVSNWDWCKISLMPCPYWCITQTRLGHGMYQIGTGAKYPCCRAPTGASPKPGWGTACIKLGLVQNIPAAVPLRVHHPNPVGARHVSN